MSSNTLGIWISVGWAFVIVGFGASALISFDRRRRKAAQRQQVVAILSRPDFRYRSEYEGTVVIYFVDKCDWAAALVILETDRTPIPMNHRYDPRSAHRIDPRGI